MKKILLLKGDSRYNVLRKAADLVALGFQNRGYEVEVLDLSINENFELIVQEISKEYSFIFSMQALLFNIHTMQGEPIVSYIKTPWIGWIVDDLLYHLPRVKNNIYDNTYILTVDYEMKRIAKKMFPNITHMIPLVHGGFCGNNYIVEPDIDVLFPGTVGEKPVWEEYAKDPMPIESFLVSEAIRVLEKKPEIAVRTAIENILNQLGEQLTTEVLLDLDRVIGYVDSYIRYQCKYKLLEALLSDGVRVHVVGEGHDDLIKQYNDLVIAHGAADIDKVIELMERSKIIINPCPAVFEKGFHERIFTAMLCRSVCFTPYTKFAEEIFGSRVEFIDMTDPHRMSARIKTILKEFDIYKENSLEDNYQWALENHCWEKRGEQIIDFYESGCNLDWDIL